MINHRYLKIFLYLLCYNSILLAQEKASITWLLKPEDGYAFSIGEYKPNLIKKGEENFYVRPDGTLFRIEGKAKVSVITNNLLKIENDTTSESIISVDKGVIVPPNYKKVNYCAINAELKKIPMLFIVKKNNKFGLFQEGIGEILPPEYDYLELANKSKPEVEKNEDLALIFKKDDLFGLIDSKGKEIIPPVYDKINYYEHGLIVVDKGELSAIVNHENKIIVPYRRWMLAKWSDDYSYFRVGNNPFLFFDKMGSTSVQAAVTDSIRRYKNIIKEGILVNKEFKKAVCDSTGKATTPYIYLYARKSNIYGSYIVVEKPGRGLAGFVKISTGQEVTPFKYDSEKLTVLSTNPLLVYAKFPPPSADTAHIFNDKGQEFLLPLKEKGVRLLNEKYVEFSTEKGDRGILNTKSFKVELEPKPRRIHASKYNNLIAIEETGKETEVFNENLEKFLDKSYHSVAFTKNHIWLKDIETNKWGAMDFKKNMAIPFQYEDRVENENIYVLTKKEETGKVSDLFDANGKRIFTGKFNYIYTRFKLKNRELLLLRNTEEMYGLYDLTNQKELLPISYAKIIQFNENIFYAKTKDGYGLVKL